MGLWLLLYTVAASIEIHLFEAVMLRQAHVILHCSIVQTQRTLVSLREERKKSKKSYHLRAHTFEFLSLSSFISMATAIM